jgi:Kef-type K+ transport system membrane component KefB
MADEPMHIDPTTQSVLVFALLALAAPIAAHFLGRWILIPSLVFEIVLGIIVGPDALDWVKPTEVVTRLSDLGMLLLFFIAGTEINSAALRGRTGRMAWLGWLISFAVGLGIGLAVVPGLGGVIIGIALCSTALGTLLPILRDAGELKTPFGLCISALGTVGEFGPVIAISVLLGEHTPGVSTLVLAVFGIIAAVAIWQAHIISHQRLHRFIERTMHTSGQLAIRTVLAILAVLVAISVMLGVDMLLGAFTAGIVWQLVMRQADPETQEQVESKIEGLAFGFLIPIFFIATGLNFDLSSLIDHPAAFLMVPVVTLTLIVVRGVPSMLAAPSDSTRRQRAAVGVMAATGLPIIVVATNIGVREDFLTGTQAAVLVGGGVLSVLACPLIATALRRAPATDSA